MTRYDRSLQCDGKVRYGSRRAARVGRRQGTGTIGHLRIYRCGWCGGYHLGHVRAHALADAELLELAATNPLLAAQLRLEGLLGPLELEVDDG